MQERVEGVYPTIDEALQAVDRLRDQGYKQSDIRLIANREVRDSFTGNVDTGLTREERSMDRVDTSATSQVSTDTHADEDLSMDRVDEPTSSQKNVNEEEGASMDRVEDRAKSDVNTHVDDERSMDRADEPTSALGDATTDNDSAVPRVSEVQREKSESETQQSFWESIKDAFTMDDSYDDSQNDAGDDPVVDYRSELDEGQVVVVVKENEDMDIADGDNKANTQPNSVGPEGTRAPEDELTAESREETLKKDHELTRHELDDYEKRH